MGLVLLQTLDQSADDQHRQDCAGFCHAYARHSCGAGDLGQAREFVRRASALWPNQRLAMIGDRALKPLWE